jgi:hypothetical protein
MIGTVEVTRGIFVVRNNLIVKFVVYFLFIMLVSNTCVCELQTEASDFNYHSPLLENTISDIPSTPNLLSPSNGTHSEDHSPTFSWSEILEATSYTLQIDNNSEFSSDSILVFENINDTSYTLSSEIEDGRWYWRVSAQNASGSGAFSEVWQVVIIPSRTVVTDATSLILAAMAIFLFIFTIILGQWFRTRKMVQGTQSKDGTLLEPRMLSGILAIIGIVTPYAMMYQSFTDPNTSELYLTINFVSTIWTYLGSADSTVFTIVSDYVAVFSLLVFVFQMIFVYSVYEYLMSKIALLRVLGAWIISQLPIIFISMPRYFSGAYPGSFFYSGPTFITLVVGYIIIRFYSPNENEIWMDTPE